VVPRNPWGYDGPGKRESGCHPLEERAATREREERQGEGLRGKAKLAHEGWHILVWELLGEAYDDRIGAP
jgi:hypothetical protein